MIPHFIAYDNAYELHTTLENIISVLAIDKCVLVMVRGCTCDNGQLFTLIKLVDYDGIRFITNNNNYWTYNYDTYTVIVHQDTIFNYFIYEVDYSHNIK